MFFQSVLGLHSHSIELQQVISGLANARLILIKVLTNFTLSSFLVLTSLKQHWISQNLHNGHDEHVLRAMKACAIGDMGGAPFYSSRARITV